MITFSRVVVQHDAEGDTASEPTVWTTRTAPKVRGERVEVDGVFLAARSASGVALGVTKVRLLSFQ